MTSISKNVYIDELDDIVKLIINDAKFKIGDIVRI